MDLWVGLACLKPNPAVKEFQRFGNGKGAYVHVVAWAESRQALEENVKRRSEELDCVLVELEDVELLESRMQSSDYPEEFINMRQTVSRKTPFLVPFTSGTKRPQIDMKRGVDRSA